MTRCIIFERSFCYCIPNRLFCSKSDNNVAKSLDYCVDLVKRADKESYLCGLLLSRNIRYQAFVIKAFNCELSTLREQVKNREAGLGRLKFWQMIVDNVFDNDRLSRPDMEIKTVQHPVAASLNWLVSDRLKNVGNDNNWNLDKNRQLLSNLIEARRQMASEYEPRLAKYADLENQGVKIFGSCAQLTLNLMGICDEISHNLAAETGQALAIINVLRSFNPVMIRKNAVMLPEDILKRHNLSVRTILRTKFKDNEQLRLVAKFLANKAADKLENARLTKKKNRVPKDLYRALIFTAIIDFYLQLLKSVEYNLYDRRLQLKNHYLPWRLYWAKFLHRF